MNRIPFRLRGQFRRNSLPAGFRALQWHSQALQKRMTFAVHLPAAYHEQPTKRWPVLYLLHGSGHDHQSVLREVCLQDAVAMLGEAILVIPDGDQGWWLDSPMLSATLYGQYVLELIEFVDHHYRTIPNRTARGVCGFSMGGYGAMLLAGQHPEVFGAASSLLGPLDIAQMFPDYYRLKLLLGSNLTIWQRYNPTHWAAKLANTALQFCTAEEAFDRPQNEAFAAALRSLHIPFEYHVYRGEHDTAFVRQHIGTHFAFHRRCLEQRT